MPRHPQGHVQRRGGQAVGGIGGEHDPLRRHSREQLDDVEREEAGDVVEHAGMVGQAGGEDPLIADRTVGEDQDGAGMAQREIDEALSERRQATSGVDQDRHTCLFGEREHALHVLSVEHEVLRPRMQLDAARAGREAALALASGSSAGSRRQNGTSRPSLSAAHASTRSLGTR